uniref:STAS domain-containing protein n=1 Tax=Setaria digitata TaxID=48799 RepID=A0A915PLR8_9BILA
MIEEFRDKTYNDYVKFNFRKSTRRLLTPCSSASNLWHWVTNFVPILQWLPTYHWKNDLSHDIIGGLTIGVMHVPQGIAYAVLAGVDPVYGLYASFFPVLFYMFFGTSRHASVGSFAVTAIMSALASDEIMIQRSEMNDTIDIIDNRTISSISYIEITTTLAFTTGIVEIVAGILQLEFITDYFSDQLVSGFITASAAHVLVAQMDDFFGIKAPKFHGLGYLFKRIYSILTHIPQSNLYTVCLSAFGVAFLYFGKTFVTPFLHKHLPFNVPIPFELFLIIISIIFSHYANLHTYHNVPVVGVIPTTLPEPRLPRLDLIADCIPYAIGIAAVTVAIHISMVKMLAKRMKYHTDSKQELYAIGITTVLSSFFPIFPVATALARTMVGVEVGIRSQLIWVVAFVATVALDVMIGLIISVLFALMTLIFRSQWPRWERLVQLSATQPYFDNPKRYASAANNPNIRLYRFQSPLLFNNVQRFKLSINDALIDWETKLEAFNDSKIVENLQSQQRYLILDCSGISYIDCMGLNILKEVVSELKSQGITVHFGACNTSVRDSLEVAEIFETIPKSCFFPTVDDAIAVISNLRISNQNKIFAAESFHDNVVELKVDSDMIAASNSSNLSENCKIPT